MLISKTGLEDVRRSILRHYSIFQFRIMGKNSLDSDQIKLLEESNFKLTNEDSLSSLDLAFISTLLDGSNNSESIKRLKSHKELLASLNQKQRALLDSLNEGFKSHINKVKNTTLAKFEEAILNHGMQYTNRLLNSAETEAMLRHKTVKELGDKLRDISAQMYRDWKRIAITETSNAISMGGVARIINTNDNQPISDIYVYKIAINDGKICKYCREFFIDIDGSPVVYKLSTLVANGSNYGKKANEWKPCIGVTHPNCRETSPLELRPGFKVEPGGNLVYIGKEEWNDYIKEKVRE